jgi:TonB-dependent starch-binding outer membrane protein SusC
MKQTILSFLLLLFAGALYAQSRSIKGKVTDDSGLPLTGVSVTVQGAATTGTQTDDAGLFTLKTSRQGTLKLVFSYTGYKSITTSADGKEELNIKLDKDQNNLDNVVVIGYGTARKGDLTGAVGILSGKEITKTPVVNVAEALTGRVAGVQVTTTEGSPDADVKIRLRGGGSVSQDNSPLYIVDGFPVSNISNIAASDIQSISFLKDASSTAIYGSRGANGVLLITTKEGKAGKISVTANAYGGFRKISKMLDVLSPYEYAYYQYELDPTGSNPTSVTAFTNYYGNFQDLDIYKSMNGRDWQDEVFGRSAQQQYYNVGISGGSKATRFNLGLTRNKEESIMIGSGYERNNLNFKLNTEISKKLNFDFNTRVSYMTIDGAGVNTGAGANTKLRNSVKYAPTTGLREFSQALADADDINNPESASLLFNPVQSAYDEYKKQQKLNSNFNAGVSWKITSDLSFRTEGGYEFRNERVDNVWGPGTSTASNYGRQPIGNISTLDGKSWRISNYFTYNKINFLPHQNLNVVVGQEALSTGYKTVTNESRFFPKGMTADAVLANMNFGTAIPTVTYIAADDRMSSYFGRVNYSIYNKYLITATYRADGSSRFAPGSQWGFFPSAAVAWKISEEDFLKSKLSWLEQLKIRASFGAAGNNKIQANAWQLLYNTSNENKPYFPNEQEASNLIPGSTLQNPLLKWETTITRNLGLDFTLFRGRLSGTLDLYYNTTRDLLLQAPVPASSGYSTQLQNYGSTTNRGIELALDGTIIEKKDFSLSATFNIAFNVNRVAEFRNGESDFKTYTSGWNGTAQPLEDYIVRKGEPVGQMYGFVTDGMYSFDDFTYNTTTQKWDINTAKGVASNQTLTSTGNYFGPGALKFKDISGPNGVPDGVIDGYDKTVIGNANPKHTGGFNLTARYKGFDVATFFNWAYGNSIYNANKLDFTANLLSRRYQNIVTDMELGSRFTTIDPVTGYNIYSGKDANPARLQELNQNATIWHPLMTQAYLHSWAIEDGSFLRLNTVTIGYTIPASVSRKIGIQNIRAYVTGYNLHVFTGYSGYDPEVDTRRNPPLTPGVDYSAYPKNRSYIAGLNITF